MSMLKQIQLNVGIRCWEVQIQKVNRKGAATIQASLPAGCGLYYFSNSQGLVPPFFPPTGYFLYQQCLLFSLVSSRPSSHLIYTFFSTYFLLSPVLSFRTGSDRGLFYSWTPGHNNEILFPQCSSFSSLNLWVLWTYELFMTTWRTYLHFHWTMLSSIFPPR